MDKQCYNEGQCKMCGCQTTALQMANKACDKPCYPSMLSKSQWCVINKNYTVYDEETKLWWSLRYGHFTVAELFKDEEAHPMSHTEETIFQKHVREYPAIKLMAAESEVFIEKMKNLNRTTKEYNEKLGKLNNKHRLY